MLHLLPKKEIPFNMLSNILIIGIVVLASILMFKGTRYFSRLARPWFWSIFLSVLIAYSISLWMQIFPWLISNLMVIIVAIMLACAIGQTIKSSKALVVFCISAGMVDFFSFSGGLTDEIITQYEQGNNLLLQYLCLSFPISDRLVPIIGIGDLIILGTIYVSFHKIGHNDLFSFLSPLLGLFIALLIGLWGGGIYALPFICGTTILYLLLKKNDAGKRKSE